MIERTALRVAAIAVAVTGAMASCSSRSERAEPGPAVATPKPAKEPAKAPAKDPAKARELIAAGALVLDVRTPDEFREAHLPTATNVPVAELDARLADVDRLARGEHGKPIVVYCGAGARAARAKRTLEAAGYTNVVNGGGLDDLR